jgi:signal transduction histidine kinase
VLFSAPLDDALAGVRLIGRTLLVAGLVALLASAVAAYTAAYGLTRRLRRLETAAAQIAAGDFSVPIESSGSDEIAELAREFDAMRLRLADLDRVRREFIANASHELRTPLFSLAGFLELLADEDLDEETRREFLEETRQQVVRLTRLATDLLDLSRLDAGRLHLEHGTVDLAAAGHMLVDEFRLLAEAGGHPLDLAAPPALLALGDEERVLRIGRALLENALAHTPPGTAAKVVVEAENDRATLAVCDEGPGISAEDRERVFQRFYRAEGGKASGSGLGLAIAAELAARMGGALRLDSSPGATRFVLELPAADAISRENGDRDDEAAAARAPATTL